MARRIRTSGPSWTKTPWANRRRRPGNARRSDWRNFTPLTRTARFSGSCGAIGQPAKPVGPCWPYSPPRTVTPVVAAFAVLLGYLCGVRGKRLLDSTWTRLLDRSPADLTDLVIEASRQGWLNYKAAGSVVEITFPGLLKPREEKAAHEQD